MSLERTACFGSCAAYQVNVSGTGAVRYNGVSDVETEGVQRATISRADVERLLRAFYAVDFFALRDRYTVQKELSIRPDGTVQLLEMMISDLPTRILTIQIGDYEKRVIDYMGAPAGLGELASLIDEVVGSAKWTGRGRPNAGDVGFAVGAPTGTIIVANMSENSVWFIDAATGETRATKVPRR